MYGEDLPLTGAGVLVIGGAAFQTWQVAAIGLGVAIVGMAMVRLARKKNGLNL